MKYLQSLNGTFESQCGNGIFQQTNWAQLTRQTLTPWDGSRVGTYCTTAEESQGYKPSIKKQNKIATVDRHHSSFLLSVSNTQGFRNSQGIASKITTVLMSTPHNETAGTRLAAILLHRYNRPLSAEQHLYPSRTVKKPEKPSKRERGLIHFPFWYITLSIRATSPESRWRFIRCCTSNNVRPQRAPSFPSKTT